MHPPLLAPFIHMLWFLVPIIVIGTIFKSSWFKGVMGEFSINISIKNNLNPEKYYLLKNVTIPCDGGTTQIDHVIVSEFGVFVLETKNMQGWIFGNERQKTWTQQIYKHKTKFQNPLHQNYKHVKTLQQLLELTDEQIYSLVIFVGNSTFKTEMPENVTTGRTFLKFIQAKTNVVFSEKEVRELVYKIKQGRLEPSLKTHFEHVRHVKSIVNEKQKPLVPIIEDTSEVQSIEMAKQCQKCGREMILRETKNGENQGRKFWGCSQFPACRSVVNVSS
jgi:restriction system protein